MPFIKTLHANLRYYDRQTILLYVLDCFLISCGVGLLALLHLESANLTQLKQHLNNFKTGNQTRLNGAVNHIYTAHERLQANYQLAYSLLLFTCIIISLLVVVRLCFRTRQEQLTFQSANWSSFKISLFYTSKVIVIFVAALVTVLVIILLSYQQLWSIFMRFNQAVLQQLMPTMNHQQASLNGLFKNHLTDFSSHNLIQQTISEATQLKLLPQIMLTAWQPLLCQVIPTFLLTFANATYHHMKRM